jgi:hypothetical protein
VNFGHSHWSVAPSFPTIQPKEGFRKLFSELVKFRFGGTDTERTGVVAQIEADAEKAFTQITQDLVDQPGRLGRFLAESRLAVIPLSQVESAVDPSNRDGRVFPSNDPSYETVKKALGRLNAAVKRRTSIGSLYVHYQIDRRNQAVQKKFKKRLR